MINYIFQISTIICTKFIIKTMQSIRENQMNQKLLFPSFLEIDEFKWTSSCKFHRKSVITLMDMVKQQLGNSLNPKFISNHRKQLQTPYFCIQIISNDKSWTIMKRLTDIVKLEEHLKVKYKSKIPSIPLRKQSELNQNNLEQVLQFFEIFLKTISAESTICHEKQFLKFIEALVPPERKKMKIFKQMQLSKRAGGRHNQSSIKRVLCYLINWRKKFFTISSEGVYFTTSDEDFRIEETIPFSFGFTLQYGEAETGYTYGILLNSSHRVLNIDAGNIYHFTQFVYWLRKAMKDNDYLSKKRFQSFASVRQKCHAIAYIDGKDYFSDVCDALLTAKNQVFITGWMISPYFCLKRPDPTQESRVDKILQKIAKSGIKVNIIVYMQPKVALNIDSQFTQEYLQALSSNIKVLRHPPYVLIPFLWSHHQKMVIIDQKIAFLGGLDIGYGRYDDNRHLLNDENEQIWYGVDYCNYRKTDIIKPKQYQKGSIDRKVTSRMPWHDIAVRITGTSVLDISRHFVQYWNYVNFQLNMDQRQLLMYAGLHQSDLSYGNLTSSRQKDKNKEQNRLTTIPNNQLNRRISGKFPEFLSDGFQVMRQSQTGLDLDRKSLQLELDEGGNQEQLQFYANHLKGENSTEKIENFFKKIKDKTYLPGSHNRQAMNFTELVVTEKKQDICINQGRQYHQMLRSASMWGLGLGQGQQQRSILKAYVELIYNSKQYIYIQNQFFISRENTVSKAIIQRINRAYENNEKFKIMVIMPSLPGFEGEIDEENSAVMRIQVHHIYKTICRGPNSIFQSLSFIKNLSDYIQFFTLRTHGVINYTPVSQIIYVHSKLMIVDDSKVLIGSANINDRSLLGSRDSEIAVLIEDTQQITVQTKDQHKLLDDTTDQKVYNKQRIVNKFAHNIRKSLYQQHFGITEQQAENYHDQDVWCEIIQRADKNQQIYRQVFGIYPDNKIHNYKDIHKQAEKADITKYDLMKTLLKGNAVTFQTQFLKDQNLQLKASQKEYFVPAINFT